MADEEDSQEPEFELSEPWNERKAELRAAYQEWSDAPYQGVKIRTLGELLWLFSERNWSGENPLPEGARSPNLSGADLRGAMLIGAHHSEATLSGADLRQATLSGVDLRGADF